MVAVFFYGLFMDAELLRNRGVPVSRAARAHVDGYRLVLGNRAMLVRADGFMAYGMLMHLEQPDLERLYAEPSVSAYRPETVRAVLENGKTIDALCYNLPAAASADPPNRDYARKLHTLGARLGLPAPYLATIRQVADDDS
jgi:hypothetical protein